MARKKRKDAETEELLAPDAFETAGGAGVSWVEANIKYLLMGAIAILLAIVAYEYTSASTERAQAEMTSELNDAVDAFTEAVDLRTVLTSTIPETVNAEYRKVLKQLQDFRAKYAEQRVAALAGLYQAELHRRLKEPTEAMKLYAGYLQTFGDDAPHAFMAYEGTGFCHEEQGELDQALQQYERMAKLGYAKPYALKHQARILEAKKDLDRARAVYEELSNIDDATDARPHPLKAFAQERLQILE